MTWRETSIAKITLYGEIHVVLSSDASIFGADKHAAVLYLDVVDNQCSSITAQATIEMTIDRITCRGDEVSRSVRWWLVKPVNLRYDCFITSTVKMRRLPHKSSLRTYV